MHVWSITCSNVMIKRMVKVIKGMVKVIKMMMMMARYDIDINTTYYDDVMITG